MRRGESKDAKLRQELHERSVDRWRPSLAQQHGTDSAALSYCSYKTRGETGEKGTGEEARCLVLTKLENSWCRDWRVGDQLEFFVDQHWLVAGDRTLLLQGLFY